MLAAIIEDDEGQRAMLESVVLMRGLACRSYERLDAFFADGGGDTVDLILVDWNLPDGEGIDLVRWAHATLSPCPGILMLTARGDRDDMIAALEAGADDYIVKPEIAPVVAARIDSVLRRLSKPVAGANEFAFGAYRFIVETRQVRVGETEVVLTQKEFTLALRLFQSRDRPLSRSYLMAAVWQNATNLPTRTLDMHVSRLRTKLCLRPENGFILRTVFGYGYRLDTCPPDAPDAA